MGEGQSVVYSLPIENSREKGFSHVYRNARFMDKLYDTPDPNFTSIRDVYMHKCLTEFKDNNFLGKITIHKCEING